MCKEYVVPTLRRLLTMRSQNVAEEVHRLLRSGECDHASAICRYFVPLQQVVSDLDQLQKRVERAICDTFTDYVHYAGFPGFDTNDGWALTIVVDLYYGVFIEHRSYNLWLTDALQEEDYAAVALVASLYKLFSMEPEVIAIVAHAINKALWKAFKETANA